MQIKPRGLNSCFCFSRGPSPGPRVYHHHHRLWPAQLLQQLRGRGQAVRCARGRGGLQGPGPLRGAGLPGPGRPGWGPDIQPLPRGPGPLSGPPLPRLRPGVRSGQHTSDVTMSQSAALYNSGSVCFWCLTQVCVFLWMGHCAGYQVMTLSLSPDHRPAREISEEFYILL